MRRLHALLLCGCFLQTTVWGQTPPVYQLRGKVEVIAGYGNKNYLDPLHGWCMPNIVNGKARGTLTLESDGLTFTNDQKKTKSSTSASPTNDQSEGRGSTSAQNEETCKIQYKDIVTLSRGDIATPTIDPTITAVTGLGSLLAGVLKGTVTNTQPGGKSTTTVSGPWLGGTIGLAGVAVLFGYLSYKHAYKANYLAISYNEMPTHHELQGCQAEGDSDQGSSSEQPRQGDPKAATLQGKASQSSTLFYRGNVVIFRLPNRKDYWDASMILSAATGCEFVSEEAEKK